MEWSSYIILGMVFASLFFIGAAYALYWAHENGQLSNFDEGARSIFDQDEEPQGKLTDSFPVKKKQKQPRITGSNQTQ